MHLRALQRGRLTVRPDEMFLRNKQPGAPAKGPLRRLIELFHRGRKLERFGRRRGVLWRRPAGSTEKFAPNPAALCQIEDRAKKQQHRPPRRERRAHNEYEPSPLVKSLNR